jgi:hypothetical protein
MPPRAKVRDIPADVERTGSPLPPEPQKRSRGRPKKANNTTADVVTQDAPATKRKHSQTTASQPATTEFDDERAQPTKKTKGGTKLSTLAVIPIQK